MSSWSLAADHFGSGEMPEYRSFDENLDWADQIREMVVESTVLSAAESA
ncbi:hypothetical protein [Roseiconus nitratireducens]|nr:hypothetical protein [Roseiconus nitratireducens]